MSGITSERTQPCKSSSSGIGGFYGNKNKRKWIGLERAIDNAVEQHRQQKIPQPFPNRILGPTKKWEIFHRQQDAFHFSRSKSKDLHVFAFEKQTFEKNTGQRLYIVASYPVFYHYYIQLKSNKRLHYEVIPEGAVCKLYFDLEYDKTYNNDCDSTQMMHTFIQYVCMCMKAVFKLSCSREDILDLDASTEKKFSRHLIFHLKNACFKNNIHAGRFVLHIMSRLLEKVKQSTEIPSNEANNDAQHSVDDTNIDKIISGKTNDAEIIVKEGDIATNSEKSADLVNPHSVGPDDKTATLTDRDPCDNVLERFTVEELKKIVVKNKHDNDVLFCDTGVYTKNRNFRLFLSSKLGKKNPLVLSTDNLYNCTPHQMGDNQESMFYSSLIANVEYTTNMKILTYGDDNTTYNLSDHLLKHTEQNNTGTDCLAGYSKSPYPEVDEYITNIITQDCGKGVIRLWTYFHQGELLVYEIARYRYCHNIGRHHRSNNIMLIADLHKGVFYQKCHDPECYNQNYKSPEWPLPSDILPANYFKHDEMNDDNDEFELNDEELLNSTLEFEKQLQQKNNLDTAVSDFDDDAVDELLIAAVDHHDNNISVTMETS